MTAHDTYKLIPVRVFNVGTVEAVVWQLYHVMRRHICISYHRVSLHRFEQPSRGGPHATIALLTPDEVSDSIQVLQKVYGFLNHMHDDDCDVRSMFDSGLERLEAMATR